MTMIPRHTVDAIIASYQDGMSLRATAELHNTSISSVRSFLRAANVPTRKKGWNLTTLERGPQSRQDRPQRAKAANTAPDTCKADTTPQRTILTLRERIAEARRQDRRAA